MKRLYIVVFLSVILFAGCATPAKRTTNDSMLTFLPYLNQKVAGYINIYNVRSLDADKYKEIVDKVCSPLPSCKETAEGMFNTYSVSVRMIDGMFSVMLCDKENKIKEMEDFSCNEQEVEIRSFENEPKTPYQFEANWAEKIRPYCPELKRPIQENR